MPDDLKEGDKKEEDKKDDKSPGGKKKDKHRQWIAIGVGVLGVVVTLLLFMKKGSSPTNSAATTTGMSPYGSASGQGGLGSAGAGDASNMDAWTSSFNQQLASTSQLEQQNAAGIGDLGTDFTNLTNEIGGLQSQLANIGNGSNTSTAPPTPTSQSSAPVPSTPAPSQIKTLVNNPTYSVGQSTGNGAEDIVSMVADQAKNGYYYLTSYGGIYTSGGAQVASGSYGGSYLGYLNSLNPAQKQANTPGGPGTGTGNFSGGNITDFGNSGYTITNSNGQKYTFGS